MPTGENAALAHCPYGDDCPHIRELAARLDQIDGRLDVLVHTMNRRLGSVDANIRLLVESYRSQVVQMGAISKSLSELVLT